MQNLPLLLPLNLTLRNKDKKAEGEEIGIKR
jgi:hypothetical protein